MSWDYRFIRTKFTIFNTESNSEELMEYYYSLHEVYYNEDGTISGWSENPINFFDRMEELDFHPSEFEWFFSKVKEAYAKPVLIEINGKLVTEKIPNQETIDALNENVSGNKRSSLEETKSMFENIIKKD